jgi:hypothetical protein
MELELLRKVAKAAKAVKNQWLFVMDYPIPHSEPLQNLFKSINELEEYEKLAEQLPDESTVYGNDCRDGRCEM